MAEPKYTRQTTETHPDPTGSYGQGLDVIAWTDDAWNREQEARRRYQADQEWQRAHPFLAGARNFLGRAGQFVNDEISLNKGNIRVRNAQRHPEGLKWFREGGNEAVALLGLGTAPMWAPEVAAALPTLSGAGEGSFLGTFVPQAVSKTAPQTANFLSWGLGGLTAYTLGRAISENPPTFSTPSFSVPYSSSRVMTDAIPTDSVSAAPANPATPTDSVGSTPTSAPEPEHRDPNNKKGFKEKQKKVLNRLKTGYGNMLTGLEYGLGFGVPVGGAAYGIYKWMQPEKTRMDSILDNQLRQVKELNKAVQINENQKKIDAILKQIQSGSSQTQQVDSNYVAPDQTVNPTDTLDF